MTLMSDERLSESMRAAIARRISEGLSNEPEAVHLLHSLNLAEAEICRLRAEPLLSELADLLTRYETAMQRCVTEAGFGEFPNNPTLDDKLAQVFQVLMVTNILM